MKQAMKYTLAILCLLLAWRCDLWINDPFIPGGKEKVAAFFDSAVMQKANDLGYDYSANYAAGSNLAKRNYRLVPPLIARSIGMAGLRVVEFLAWVTLGACIYLRLARISQRVGALGMIATFCTSSGSVYFVDLGHTGDTIAQALLAVNLLGFYWPLALVTTTAAMFTDERAVLLIIAPLAFAVMANGWRAVIPYCAALAIYAGGRLVLGHFLYAPTNYADVGCMDYALSSIRLLPAVIWGAFEGGWILIIAAAWFVFKINRVGGIALLVYPVGAISLSLAVLDMTRSASYVILFPVIAVAMIARSGIDERKIAWLCAAGALISVVCPNSMFISGFIEQWG